MTSDFVPPCVHGIELIDGRKATAGTHGAAAAAGNIIGAANAAAIKNLRAQ